MINYKKKLYTELEKYEKKEGYQQRIAGDISTFRYPHLDYLSSEFEFDDYLKSFILKKDKEKIISEITINDITTYELLNYQAKRLHLYDFLGFTPSVEEKYQAFLSVKEDYLANKKNKRWMLPYKIEKIALKDIKIKDDFEYLKTFIRKSKDCEVYFYEFQNIDHIFQFGSTLKGTNIVIIDNHKSNFYQELFHIIYHLEETIPGVDNDNLNIIETWGNVDALYIKQLLEGRISRRIRKNNSPHDVKFLDYVFLRAYIGTAFAAENENLCFHSVFALIEPTIKLLMHCINGSIKQKNKVIIDAICFDKTNELKDAFNKKFGQGAYEKVFYDFKLFNRLKTIKALCKYKNINYNNILKIMFNKQSLVPTIIGDDVVKYIWENDSVNQNKDFIVDLIENYSMLAMKGKHTLNMNNIKDYINKN